MAYDVTFTQETLCKGSVRNIGEVLNVDDETARMLVDLGVATAAGLSPQTGSSAALFADTFLSKSNNLVDVNSVPDSRTSLDVYSKSEVENTVLPSRPLKAAAWNSSTSYTAGDFVSMNGATFIAMKNNTNKKPLFEVDCWEMASSDWRWLTKSNIFANYSAKVTGFADTSGSSTATNWARASATGAEARVMRAISLGVPTFFHAYADYEVGTGGTSNRTNFNRAGKLVMGAAAGASNVLNSSTYYLDCGRFYGGPSESSMNSNLDKMGFGFKFILTSGVITNVYATINDSTANNNYLEFEVSLGDSGVNYLSKYEISWDGNGTMAWWANGKELYRRSGTVFTGNTSWPVYASVGVGTYANTIGSSVNLIWWKPDETYFVCQGGLSA